MSKKSFKYKSQENIRGIAFSLIALFLFQIILPSYLCQGYAAAVSPETQSFEPASTSDMVDLFTGDFHYNIPLLNVPGPGGGYPVNLSYQAGPKMQQEASWVGLGWSLNPGSVERQLRGIPDDYKGDQVIKTKKMRDMWHLEVAEMPKEEGIIGGPVLNPSMNTGLMDFSVYLNNYVGYGLGLAARFPRKKQDNGLRTSLDIGISSSGSSLNPSFSFVKYEKGIQKSKSFGLSLNSQGKVNLSFNTMKSQSVQSNSAGRKGRGGAKFSRITNGGVSLGPSLPVSFSPSERTNNVFRIGYFKGEFDVNNFQYPNGKVASFSRSKMRNTVIVHEGYGFLNNSEGQVKAGNGDETAFNPENFDNDEDVANWQIDANILFDVYTTNNQVLSKESKFMYQSYLQKDEFFEQNQGRRQEIELNSSNLIVTTPPQHFGLNSNQLLEYERASTFDPLWGHQIDHWGVNADPGFSFSYYGGIRKSGKELHASDYIASATRLESPSQITLDQEYFNYKGENAIRYKLGRNVDGFKVDEEFYEPQQGTSFNPGAYKSEEHASQSSYVYLNISESNDLLKRNNIYDKNEPYFGGSSEEREFLNAENDPLAKHLMGAIICNSESGMRYEYGLPEFTLRKESRVFSLELDAQDGSDLNIFTGVAVGYDNSENSIENSAGFDHYFEKTTYDPFATSFKLTAIFSADYVDLTNNGPSPDDLGSYVKFNYTCISDDYGLSVSRTPSGDHAVFMSGNLDNDQDDKAYIETETSEQYVLHSIETKTHVAVFLLSDEIREDRRNSLGIDGGINIDANNGHFSLDKIQLFSLSDPNKILKEVNLRYNYELCSGTPNSSSGKLTLKSVHISNFEDANGLASPYTFEYDASNLISNPVYDLNRISNWGGYHNFIDSDSYLDNINRLAREYPYVNQDPSASNLLDEYAGAWCLKDIYTPSGSHIHVTYESDCYGFVQDERADVLYPVVFDIQDENELEVNAVFKVDMFCPFDQDEEDEALQFYNEMVNGLDEIYFSTMVDLKRDLFDNLCSDRIEGYGSLALPPLDERIVFDENRGKWLALISFEPEDLTALGTGTIHPVRKAAFEHLRRERNDLFNSPLDFDDGEPAPGHLINAVGQLLSSIPQMLSLYGSYKSLGYCKYLRPGIRTSYLRMKSPRSGKKSGTHRVKSISIDDNWGNNENGYKTIIDYKYENENGETSGVIEYEPRSGGKDNCLNKPRRLTSKFYNALDLGLFSDEVISDYYFNNSPVGYSRVVVSQKADEVFFEEKLADEFDEFNFEETNNGLVVNEFFTYRDFPHQNTATDLEFKRSFPQRIVLPGAGVLSNDVTGMSQGFSMVKTDMHGKPKATSIHLTNDSNFDNPVAKTIYEYHISTAVSAGLSKLDNVIPMLNYNGEVLLQETGVASVIHAHHSESQEFSILAPLEWNLLKYTYGSPPTSLIIPTLFPSVQVQYSDHRAINLTKLIRKNGILTKTTTISEGRSISQENLVWDQVTGLPILSKTTNNHDAPIYDLIQLASYNLDNSIPINLIEGERKQISSVDHDLNEFTLTTPYEPQVKLEIGDQVMLYSENDGTNYSGWVSSSTFNSNGDDFEQHITLIDLFGSPIQFDQSDLENISGYQIIESNRSISPYTQLGGIQSLNNPLNGYTGSCMAQFLQEFNQWVDEFNPVQALSSGEYDCENLPFPDIEFECCNIGFNTTPCFQFTTSGLQVSFDWTTDDDPTVFQTTTIVIPSIESCCICEKLISETPIDGYLYVDCSQVSGSCVIHPTNCPIDEPCLGHLNGQGDLQNLNEDHSLTEVEFVNSQFPDFESIVGPCVDRVLQTSALVYEDNITKDFKDQLLVEPNVETYAANNPYAWKSLGIFKLKSHHFFQENRDQNDEEPYNILSPDDFLTVQQVDGTFTLYPFDWNNPENNPAWIKSSQTEVINSQGLPVLTKDALNIKSCVLVDNVNHLALASVVNSSNQEVFSENFETTDLNNSTSGNFFFNVSNINGGGVMTPNIVTDDYHTGKKCLSISENTRMEIQVDESTSNLELVAGKNYLFSSWFKSNEDLKISVFQTNMSNPIFEKTIDVSNENLIEGWLKVDVEFAVQVGEFEPDDDFDYVIHIESLNGALILMDDTRLCPSEAAMSAQVYDIDNYFLLAELDDNNFAIFYQYDGEGNLVQVKRETAKGVKTIRITNGNIQRND